MPTDPAELDARVEVNTSRLAPVGPRGTWLLAPASEARTLVAGASEPAGEAPPAPAGTRYATLAVLGKGAMGEVHVARDEDLLRKVALKRMVPEVAGRRELAARFFGEAQVTAQLDHPNIVPIYGLEAGGDGSPGYAMKLVQGRTVGALLEQARGDGDDAQRLAARLEIFLKVCDAMAYAHAKGVLHRDLKPENVMVGRYNEVYVMDWGICRLIGSDDASADQLVEIPGGSRATDRTQLGAILGTPAYMSPEQASGRNHELDGRSDQYALGLILHELVSLRPPLSGDSLEDVLRRAGRGDRDPLVHAQGLPIARELRAIVARATAPRREDRYPNVAALADDLRRHLRGEAVEAAPDNLVQAAARFVGRHRAAALAALLALVVLGAGAAIGLLVRHERALEDARLHEERIADLFAAAAEQSHLIDNHFYRFEALLAGLAGRASEALARDGDGADLQALLGPALEAAVLGSASDNDAHEPADAHRRLEREGLPIHRASVRLAGGARASWPSAGDDSAAFRLAADRRGMHWGEPFTDGGRVLLPMAASLWRPDGGFLGVAAIDTTFEYIAGQLLVPPGRAEIDDAFLVDEEGRAVVSRSARLESRPFPYPEVLARARAERSGLSELPGGKLAVFAQLASLGWTYVVVADEARLLR
jgi:serine/threonine-protein kinase